MANQLRSEQRRRTRREFEVDDLSGGFVSQAATYNIDERFLADSQNMELIQGMWQKRKGFHLSGSFAGVAPAKNTNKGFHVCNLQGNLHILGVYGNTLYDTYLFTKDAGGKIISNTLPTVERFRFADFHNACYIAHGKDSIFKFDGNDLTETNSPPGNILAVYDNRILLAGIKGDTLTFYYSERGDGKQWNALNYIVLDGRSNEHITAMVPLQGKLFIFTNRAIYSLIGNLGENFAVSREVDGVGAVSPEAVQVFGNRFYFVMGNGKIFEFDGGNFPTEISKNITQFISSELTFNDLKHAALTFYKNGVWFTFDNSVEPSQRLTLVYYPDYQAWTKFTGIPAAAYAYVDHETMLFTGAHNEGSLYQYGTQFNDDTDFIKAYMKTVRWDFNALENLKRFKELYLRGAIQSGGGNGFDMDFLIDGIQVASVRVTSDIATATEIWGDNDWGDMYWGYAGATSETVWGDTTWGEFDWAGAEIKFSSRWGTSVWNQFRWGEHKEGSLSDDVGRIYQKLYLSQYNVISGKTLQLVLRDNTPHHGFRFENMMLQYIQKGAR